LKKEEIVANQSLQLGKRFVDRTLTRFTRRFIFRCRITK